MSAREPFRGPSIPAVTLLLSLAAAATFGGQERPKIGLALGGGGAKGGAHVGVLEVLEELNVPIDYVAGTSIGAIVGGLYASGMSTAEIREVISTVDWDAVLSDGPERRDLAFRRKEEDSLFLIDFEVGVGRSGLKWPGGLISGQNLFFLLQALTLPVAETTDFDRLPIPFRAVATDVNLGEVVVLDRGQLATAIRASMALPGIFAPVQLDGRLLVDGGLVRNLPVDVVRDMGADIVIAVDLGAPLSSRDVERSMLQIYQQTMRMLTRPNVEPQLKQADLAIVPPVSGFGTMSFDSIVEIIDLGYEEARARADQLRPFSIDPEEYERHRAARRQPESTSFEVAFIDFEGNERVDDRVIAQQLRLEAGTQLGTKVLAEDIAGLLRPPTRKQERARLRAVQEVDLTVLSEDLRRIYGLGDFESVDFRFEERDGQRGLVVLMREKPWGPNYLRFGLEITGDFSNPAKLGFLTSLNKTRLNSRGGEWRTSLLVGGDRALVSELYQPLDFKGRVFFSPRIAFENELLGLFEAGQNVADLDVSRFSVGADLGYQLDVFGELRLGIERSKLDVNLQTGSLPEDLGGVDDLEDIDLGGLVFRAVVDRLDSVTFPRRGNFGLLRLFYSSEDLGADDEYSKFDARVSRFMSRGKNTGWAALEAGWSPGSVLPVYDEFTLGGFGSLSGFADRELRGQYLGTIRLGYYRRAWKGWQLGGFAEAGNVWKTSDEAKLDNLILAGTVFAGRETIIGPLYIAYGRAEGGKNKVYLVIGRTLQ